MLTRLGNDLPGQLADQRVLFGDGDEIERADRTKNRVRPPCQYFVADRRVFIQANKRLERGLYLVSRYRTFEISSRYFVASQFFPSTCSCNSSRHSTLDTVLRRDIYHYSDLCCWLTLPTQDQLLCFYIKI
jgi:hypothetical protein